MTNELMIATIKESGLETIECESISEFIEILKVVESIETEIPGIKISMATDEDNLNEGETLSDLRSGEATHYCAKTHEGDKFISNDKLESWASEFLIDENARPMNLSLMRENGFSVYPGEADSFGWLTGVLETKLGQLVFG